MSMDVRMVMLDVLCTFWEGAMIAWLLHLFARKKISLKMDLVIVCIFVLAAESMTFTGMNVVVKLILTMSSNVAGAKLCCKSSVRVSEILLAHAVVTFAIASMEMCVSTVCELIEIEHKYHGIPYIFHVGYWYLVMHLLANIVVVLLKKFLLKIHASMSAREKLVLFLSLFSISLLLCGLMAYPTKNQVFNKIGVIAGIAVLTVAFFSLVLYFNESIQARLRRQQEKHEWMQMQAQCQYYQERLEQEQRVRQMYHDMKNHLLVLQSQIAKLSDAQEGEKEKTAQMIASLQSQIFDYENFEKTGNAFLDVIVRDKMRAAKDKEIDVQIDVDISKAVDLDGLDISTIFGNALDNALEACEKVEKEERFLTFRSGVRNGYQVFQIENAAAEEGADGKTSKEDTYLHGFGMQNIKRAVEKYEGACQYQCQDGVFSLHILLPLKDPCFSEK